MIDARNEVLPSVGTGSRRTRSTPVSRNSRKRTSPARSLRLERVFSDAKTKPFDQLEWDRRTAEITDDSGKVQLSGTARSKAEKRKAAELAKSVEGVVAVDNRIRVAAKKQSS